MIAVIVPVHNEEQLLHQCLNALIAATTYYSATIGEPARIYIVLDSSTDRSKEITEYFDVEIIECDVRSVGAARARGATAALSDGARWLAFTDGDTQVASDWLTCQLCLESDAVCGTIGVDWPPELFSARQDFEINYQDIDGHRHIHGANLGMSAAAYLAVGGFSDRCCHEDVAIVKCLIDLGFRVCWSAVPRVTTSGRLDGRAPHGIAAALKSQFLHDHVSFERKEPELISADERLRRSFFLLDSGNQEVLLNATA